MTRGKQGPKETWELNRPTGGPRGELRTWYEVAVMNGACRRFGGLAPGSDRELLAVADVLRRLGGDALGLLLDAAVTALHARCEPRRSPAGRRPDAKRHWRERANVALFRDLVAISRVAAATRQLPEGERRNAIARAVNEEVLKRSDRFSKENYGRGAIPADLRQGAVFLKSTEEWLALIEPSVKAMLAKYGPGRRTLEVPAYEHDDDAAEALERLGFDAGDALRLRAAEKDVAERSTVARKRARAVAAALSL